jgi:SAM-dependent methyltransferase
MKDGSSTKEGHIYHELVGSGIPAQRLGMEERAKFIIEKLGGDVKGKIILDLGCNVGGLSYLLAQAGAKVIGIDYDEEAINIGKKFLADKKLEGSVELIVKEITPQFIEDLSPNYDAVLWLSQWQWFCKQHSLKEGYDALFNISKRAKQLVFESSADDGRANIEGATQDDLYLWLIEYTGYQKIQRFQPDVANWHKRDVFFCSQPEFQWRRHRHSIVKRISKKYVSKINEKGKLEETELREIKFLQEMADSKLTPRVLAVKDNSYTMKYAGIPITKLTDEDIQFILSELKKYKVVHRDITPSNLRWNGQHIVLIDFGWAIHEGEDLPAPEGLGEQFKAPEGFDDEYSLKKVQQYLNENIQ